ncbi:hypothetical protein [Daphnis nerii cypovirus]|uniref:hypothetical protein n=1 Tax=Daphnis nerii cypovirus TaxID=1986950 RepID=UPI000EB71B64|nr:hypothetical protein [Daphnis nerii cypovirus]AYA29388.1 hypothetical protein [Daphnis nerii cypovirus]
MFIEIQSNDNVLVVLQIRVEHRLTSGGDIANSSFTSIPTLYANENGAVFTIEQSFLRRIQINRGTSVNGVWRGIGLNRAVSVLDMTILNLFILSKDSIGPVIDVTGSFNIKVHYGENVTTITSSDFDTGELVFGGVRYYGQVCAINRYIECVTISERLRNVAVGVETISGGVMAEESFPAMVTETNKTYLDTQVLQASGIRNEFNMRLVWSSGNNTASVTATSTVPYSSFQQSPYVNADVTLAVVGDTGKRWHELSNQPNMTDQQETEEFLRAILIECKFIRYDMRILQAPGDIGIRRVIDEQQSIQNVINESLFREIERLEERIETIEDQVEYLQKQFEMYLASQEGAWWETLLDVFIDLALGIALPGIGSVIGEMYSSLRKASGLSRRLTNAKILGITNKEVQKKVINGARISPGDLTVSDGWVNGVLGTLQKKRSDFTPPSRPAYRLGNTKFQHLDDSEKIDVWSNFRFGKRHEHLENKDLARSTSRLREFDPDLFPNFTVHARPLNIGPGKVSKKIFEMTDSANKARSAYYSDLHKVNTRRPMHSFVVYETLDYQDSGRYLTTKRYIGVNEMSRNVVKEGDFGSSIGGLRVKYETWKIRGSDGKLLSSPLSHTESGYSASDVDRLFASAFGKEVNGFELGTAAKWEMLVSKVDNQILKSKEIYSTLVTNSSMGAALDVLLNRPPTWKYNLLFNNCQDFARDITRIVKGENFKTSRWDSNLISEISRIRTINLTDILTSSTSVRAMTISPLYGVITDNDGLYRRTQSRRRVYALMHDNRGWMV